MVVEVLKPIMVVLRGESVVVVELDGYDGFFV